jgi:hypothetical protein
MSSVIANILNRDFVLHQLEAVRVQLDGMVRPSVAVEEEAGLDPEDVEDTLRAVNATQAKESSALGQPALEGAGDEDLLDAQAFISRDPIVSLLQTIIAERIEARHGDLIQEQAPGYEPGTRLTDTPIADKSLSQRGPEEAGDPFTKQDPGWIREIAKALVERWRKGKHPFNRQPAPELEIADDSRVVLFSDWGTGLPRAEAVSQEIRRRIEEVTDRKSADPPKVHVIHLGDVYYSGDKSEYEQHVLGPGLWPVDPDEAGDVTSWSLNGNHDMYSGGWGYFDTLLADGRFKRQRAPDGSTTSFFSLVTPHWRIIGLDTAWEDHLTKDFRAGYLQDPQAELVEKATTDQTRKVMLLSHHQLFTVRDHVGPSLERKLEGALTSGRIASWFWGHEHRCMAFEPHMGVGAGRCIGHGGVPVLVPPEDDPCPPPCRYEYRGFLDEGGKHWARFGFAVLDFNGPEINVTYINDLGVNHYSERIS